MRRNTMLVLAGAAALALAGLTGCEREVAREETIVEENGVVTEREMERTVEENGVRREEVEETAPAPAD